MWYFVTTTELINWRYFFVHQSRPFGVAMLFAGVDKCGPQLYHLDPSGTFLHFGAKAIGSGSEGAQQSLQEAYHTVCGIPRAVCVGVNCVLFCYKK